MAAGVLDAARGLLPQWAEDLAKAAVGPPGRRLIGRRYQLQGGYERIYLYHVRKTGGTSIANSFLALGNEEPLAVKHRMTNVFGMARTGDYVFAANVTQALEGGRYFLGWSHDPAWMMSLPERTYTVTVLRDPTARVISLYRYLRDPDSDGDEPSPAPQKERDLTKDGFDAWLDRLPPNHLLNQLHMFSRSLDPAEAAAALQRCSLVFRTEDMAAGVKVLADLIGRELPVRRERRSTLEFQPSDTQLQRLREMLAPEYELMERLQTLGVVRSSW